MKTDLVVAGYIIHDNKVLLIHHKKLDLWLPVGGHIDPNETPDDALKREIKEEVGLNVDIHGQADMPITGKTKRNLAQPFHVNVHDVGDHDHCCFYYVCTPENPEQLRINNELKNFQWVSKEELNQDHIPEDIQHLARKAFEVHGQR